MKQGAWFWIIGGAIFVVGLTGWETFRRPRAIEGSGSGSGGEIGTPIPDTLRWEYLETVGTNSDGIEYIVQTQRKDIIGRDGPISMATGRWRPMRSDGRGGYMGIFGERRTRIGFTSRQEAYDEALAALEGSEPRQSGGPITADNPLPPNTGTYEVQDEVNIWPDDVNERIYDVTDVADRAAGGYGPTVQGTDLLDNDGLLDGMIPA